MSAFDESDLHGLRVLVAEDAFSMALVIETTLKALGCSVLGPAPRVDKALMLMEQAPDCAILDVSLEGGDAYPIADALKARGIPFILTTGYDAASVHPDFRDVPRLEKPFGMEALVQRMVAAFLPRRD